MLNRCRVRERLDCGSQQIVVIVASVPPDSLASCALVREAHLSVGGAGRGRAVIGSFQREPTVMTEETEVEPSDPGTTEPWDGSTRASTQSEASTRLLQSRINELPPSVSGATWMWALGAADL